MIIRQLLLILVAYLLIQFISKAWRFRKAVLQQRDHMMDQMRAYEKQSKTEGEVNISNKSKSSSTSSTDDVGTYIDYEEVD